MLTLHPEVPVGELQALRNAPVVGKEEKTNKRIYCFCCGLRTPQPAI